MERNIGGYAGTQEAGDGIDDGAEEAGDTRGFWERFKGTRRRRVEEEDIWGAAVQPVLTASAGGQLCAARQPRQLTGSLVSRLPQRTRRTTWILSVLSCLLRTTCFLAACVPSSLLPSLKPEIIKYVFHWPVGPLWGQRSHAEQLVSGQAFVQGHFISLIRCSLV